MTETAGFRASSGVRSTPAPDSLLGSLATRVDLPPTLRAAPVARRFVRSVLDEWGFDADDAYTAQVVVSELAANAARHAAGSRCLELALVLDGDGVTVGLTDGSPVEPVVVAPTADREDGRGMSIVARLADDWGTARVGDGKQVWARLRLARA